MPATLRRYTGPGFVDTGDPSADAETNSRFFRAWRAWRAKREGWAAENGWTPRQLLGLDNPHWIAHGWADEPPTRASSRGSARGPA